MGGTDDDANDGPGECPGHDWAMISAHLDGWGMWRDYRCRHCGGLLTATPDQDEPGALRTW